jgi:hypothetical protein
MSKYPSLPDVKPAVELKFDTAAAFEALRIIGLFRTGSTLATLKSKPPKKTQAGG